MTEENANEETSNIYSDVNKVRSLIKYTGDEADDDLFQIACDNADATVKSKLSKFRIPEPNSSNIPVELHTAANYYAASDILQSLYNGEERSGNEQAYYQKADELEPSTICEVLGCDGQVVEDRDRLQEEVENWLSS